MSEKAEPKGKTKETGRKAEVGSPEHLGSENPYQGGEWTPPAQEEASGK